MSERLSLGIGPVYDSISKTSPPNGGTDISNGYTVDFNVYKVKPQGRMSVETG